MGEMQKVLRCSMRQGQPDRVRRRDGEKWERVSEDQRWGRVSRFSMSGQFESADMDDDKWAQSSHGSMPDRIVGIVTEMKGNDTQVGLEQPTEDTWSRRKRICCVAIVVFALLFVAAGFWMMVSSFEVSGGKTFNFVPARS